MKVSAGPLLEAAYFAVCSYIWLFPYIFLLNRNKQYECCQGLWGAVQCVLFLVITNFYIGLIDHVASSSVLLKGKITIGLK